MKDSKQTQNSIDIFRIKDMLKYNIYNSTDEVSGFGMGVLWGNLDSQLNLHFYHLNLARRWT